MSEKQSSLFFSKYAILLLTCSLILVSSYVYAEVIVGTTIAGQLDNATITVSLLATVPTKQLFTYPYIGYSLSTTIPAKQELSYVASYSGELIINSSGVLTTIPFFQTTTTETTTTSETSTTTTTTTTATSTTSSIEEGGGGGIVGEVSESETPAPNETSTPTPTETLPLPAPSIPEIPLPDPTVGLLIIVFSFGAVYAYRQLTDRNIGKLWEKRYKRKDVSWRRRRHWWE